MSNRLVSPSSRWRRRRTAPATVTTATAAAAVALFSACVPASAQEPAPVAPGDDTITLHQKTRSIMPDGTEVYTLTDVVVPRSLLGRPALARLLDGLSKLDWDADVHGPLLAVAPETVGSAALLPTANTPGTPVQVAAPPMPTTDGKYRLPDLADYFWRRIVRLPEITVLAPALTARLTVPSPPSRALEMVPDLTASSATLAEFEETLTAAQWQAFAEDNGIGLGDLRADQRALFRALAPSSFRFVDAVVPVGSGPLFDPSNPGRTLTDDERSSVRLSIHRKAFFSILTGPATMNFLRPAYYRAGATAHMRADPSPDMPVSANGDGLVAVAASRLKPQQIDFDAPALAQSVALTGAATVDEIVRRVREATGVQVFVDRRLGARSVWIRLPAGGLSLPAGETLKALCWGVDGAIRDLGAGVFVLTRDVDGYGSRVSRIAVAIWPEMRREQALDEERVAAVQAIGPERFIGFDSADLCALPASMAARFEDSYAAGNGDALTLPVTALPDTVQQAVQAVAASPDIAALPAPVPVHVEERLAVSWVVPGVGEVSDPHLGGGLPLDELLPSPDNTATAGLRLPAPLTLGVSLCVAAASPEEAADAVRTARSHGLRRLWLKLPPPGAGEDSVGAISPAASAILRAAVEEAHRDGPPVQIVPVIRVLTRESAASPGPADPPTPGIDRNVLGEATPPLDIPAASRDAATTQSPYLWMDPTEPSAIPSLAPRVRSVTSLPGITDIAFMDVAAPGYRGPTDPAADGAGLLGYTPSRRRDFVASNGSDPIDVADVDWSVTHRLQLSGFDAEDPSTPRQNDDNSDAPIISAWRAARAATARQFAEAARRSLPDPPGPCWIDVPPETFGQPERLLPWPLDAAAPNAVPPTPGFIVLRFDGSPDDAHAVDEFLDDSNYLLKDASAAKGGVMIDLSAVPTSNLSSLLDRILPSGSPSPAASGEGAGSPKAPLSDR